MYTDHPYQRELTGLDPVCIRRDMLSELESKLYSVIFVLFTADKFFLKYLFTN